MNAPLFWFIVFLEFVLCALGIHIETLDQKEWMKHEQEAYELATTQEEK